MKTIIVATDFSAAARNAAAYAAEMALAIQADLHLLHVYQLPVVYGEVPVPMNIEQWQQDAEDSLTALQAELESQTKGLVHISVEVRAGHLMPELEAVCKQRQPYTVVIGSTGKSAAERWLFGSNAIQTMKHLAWPVITVPVGVVYHDIQKIGLACDLEQVSETVPVAEIGQLVKAFHAELHILNIGQQNKYHPADLSTSGWLGERLAAARPRFHFLSHQDTDQGILEFAENNHIDLLIVLPKRHSFPEVLVHKSHTRQFVLHSHVPLMALHAQPPM